MKFHDCGMHTTHSPVLSLVYYSPRAPHIFKMNENRGKLKVLQLTKTRKRKIAISKDLEMAACVLWLIHKTNTNKPTNKWRKTVIKLNRFCLIQHEGTIYPMKLQASSCAHTQPWFHFAWCVFSCVSPSNVTHRYSGTRLQNACFNCVYLYNIVVGAN